MRSALSAIRAVESIVQGGLEAAMLEVEEGVRLVGAGGARVVAMVCEVGWRRVVVVKGRRRGETREIRVDTGKVEQVRGVNTRSVGWWHYKFRDSAECE